MPYHEYQIIGRRRPEAEAEKPPLFRMKIFAKNPVVAKSRFWCVLRQQKKIKKCIGEVLTVNEIFEKNPLVVKNFGIYLKYMDRGGLWNNMYREYRDTTLTNAITRLYQDMASKHKAPESKIQIIKVKQLKSSECKRPYIKCFHDRFIRFPLTNRLLRPSSKQVRTTFKAKRPSTYLQ